MDTLTAHRLIAISLYELIKDNHSGTNLKSLNTEVKEVRYKKTNPNLFTFLVRSFENYSSPTGHLVNIKLLSNKRGTILKQDVRVSCTCPAFTYWGSKYNATIGEYNYRTSTKIAPDKRDPNRLRKVCKHIASLRLYLKNRTKHSLNKKLQSANEFVAWDDEQVRDVIAREFPDLQDYGLEALTDSTFEKLMEQMLKSH